VEFYFDGGLVKIVFLSYFGSHLFSLRGCKACFLFTCICVCVLCIQVYVAEVTADVAVCTKRNTHQRKQAEIQKVRRCRAFFSDDIILTTIAFHYWVCFKG